MPPFFSGSVVQNQTTNISDVDLLVIVNNDITKKQIRSTESILKAIEIKHGFGYYSTNWVTAVLRVVEKTTGMFASHFICRREAWDLIQFCQYFFYK